MKRYTFSKFVLSVFVLGAMVIVPAMAWAGSQVFDSQNTCTAANCSSMTINGTYQFDAFNNANPFTLQVFSSGGECLRINMSSQGTDLESVLVSPSGLTWRDDDGGAGVLPLIRANTDVRGWYNLSISRFNGGGPQADFTVNIGRYNSGNPNCAGATVPFFESQSELQKPDNGGASGKVKEGPSTN